MMDKKSIKSGDDSINIQAQNITYNENSMTYTDVKNIAMDVFKSNFYDLGKQVNDIVQKRAEEILDDYLEKLKNKKTEYINRTANPDIRYIIYETQKNYARRGDENIKDILVETLIKRTTEDQTFQELVLNEALEIIPKITYKQINILSLMFVLEKTCMKNEGNREEILNYIYKIAETISIKEHDDFDIHLQYASCIYISIGHIEFDILIKNVLQIENDQELETLINSEERLKDLRKLWNDSQLCHCNLTSVGTVIGMMNLKVKLNLDLDLSVFITE